MTKVLFSLILLLSFYSHAELGGGAAEDESTARVQTNEPGGSCTAEEREENQSIVNECNANWASWGISPVPPQSELRDVNNCSGLVSMGTLEGCADAIIAFPIFMAEMGARALVGLLPTDKNTLAYVSQNGSLQEIAAYLTNEFFKDTCGISPPEEAEYAFLKCDQHTETNPHLNPEAASSCRAEALNEIQTAMACRRSSETRTKYRGLRAQLTARANSIKAAQDERRRVETEFQRDIAEIKNSCGIYMNPLAGSMRRYISPLRYLATEAANAVAPRASQVQEFNDCVERKTEGKLELREALVRSSTGLLAQISGSFSAMKCYSERERKKLMCDVAIAVVSGGVALGANTVRMLGSGAAAGFAKMSGRAAARNVRNVAEDAGGDAARAATLRANGALSDVERVAAAETRLGRQLTSVEQDAVIQAHNVGADRIGSGIGNYTQAEIAEKARILRDADFPADERSALIRDGIAGRTAQVASAGDDLSLGQLATTLGRNDQHRSMTNVDADPRWFEKPDVRSDVANEVRTHLDNGGVLNNEVQREGLRRVLAAEAYDASKRAGARATDYNTLTRRYQQMGYPEGWPLTDSTYMTSMGRGIQPNASDFQLQSRIMDSRMAINQMQARVNDLNNPMIRRGLDIEERAAASEMGVLRDRISEIEDKMRLAEGILSSR